MNISLLISCLLCANPPDSGFDSILKRVALRDSTTHAIIAVKFPDRAETDACLARYKKFDISKSDSQSFSVTLSPMYSGYIGYGVGALRIRLNAALSGIHPHYLSINARMSALMTSAWVVHMPCGNFS
jgi:hypothetical protein